MEPKKRFILTTLIVFIAFSMILLGYFSYAVNYNEFYGLPSVEHAAIDLNGMSLEDKQQPVRLSGEWEFYYNEFIISDGYSGEQGAIINIPDKWTNLNYNGTILPKSGYASYKLTVKNAKIGDKIIVCNNYADVAFRTFINGKLCFETGVVSKDPSATVVSGKFDYEMLYTIESETLEIVIETSSSLGGLFKEPLLISGNTYQNWNDIDWYANALTYFVIGVIILSTIVYIIANTILKNKQTNYLYTLLFVSLLFHFFTTIDSYMLVCNSIRLFKFSMIIPLSIISAFIYLYIMAYIFLKDKINKSNIKLHGILFGINLISITLFLVFIHLNLCYLFLIPCCLILLYYIYIAIQSVACKEKNSILKLIISLLSILLVFIEVTDNIGVIEVGTRTVFNYGIILLLILYFSLGIDRLKNIKSLINNVEAIKNEKLKHDIESGNLTTEVKIITFGQFNVFINGNVLTFKSSKSKELLALLIDKLGGELTIDEVITRLYPDKAPELAKKSYRDILIKLRAVLQENQLEELLVTERGKVGLNKNLITYCDLWEQLENPKDINIDEYMISYDWAIERSAELNKLKNKE